jgi:hypothetical protein
MTKMDVLLSLRPGVLRKGVPRLIVGLTFTSALISALLLATPWSIVVAVSSLAAALLTWVDLKVRDQQTAEHDFLLSQTSDGELAILAESQAAARELDAIVRVHFEEFPETNAVACRYCDWRTDDFADRLRLAPEHLLAAHPQHDPRVPRLVLYRVMRVAARLLPSRPARH